MIATEANKAEWTYGCRDCGCKVRPSKDPDKALECVTEATLAQLTAEVERLESGATLVAARAEAANWQKAFRGADSAVERLTAENATLQERIITFGVWLVRGQDLTVAAIAERDDARGERDAYRKSYDEARAERDAAVGLARRYYQANKERLRGTESHSEFNHALEAEAQRQKQRDEALAKIAARPLSSDPEDYDHDCEECSALILTARAALAEPQPDKETT